VRLNNLTLALCPGCGALISHVNFVKESEPAMEAPVCAIGRSESIQTPIIFDGSKEPVASYSQSITDTLSFFASANYSVFVPGNYSHGLSTVVRSVASPDFPAAHVSHSEARALFDDFFEVFTHRGLALSPEYAFFAIQDMRSVCTLSLT
jgi:hypothetical protein